MHTGQMIKLNSNDVDNISSDYIKEGRLYESWQINEVIIEGKKATMYVSMIRTYPPGSNKKDFHLSKYTFSNKNRTYKSRNGTSNHA